MDEAQKIPTGRHRSKALHLIEQSRDAVWVAQLDASLVYVNQAAARLLAGDESRLLGSSSWLSFVHEEDQANIWPELTSQGEGSSTELEYRIVLPDNTIRWVQDRRQRFHDPTDATDYIGGTWRDISAERARRAEEIEARRRAARTQQLQRLDSLRRLASGIGHSFSNSLTPIMSFSELALGSLPHGHPAANDLQQIIASSRQANALLQQLVAFSRKQHLQKRPLDLNDLIRATAPTLRGIAGSSIRLQTELCFAPSIIRADRACIEQVLVSLMANARDAMPNGGRVMLRTQITPLREADLGTGLPPGEYVRLIVQDTGAGIDPRIIDHIFEPFFTTRRAEQDAGLGLATTYGIVTQHKGAILVESELGQGSTFQLLFLLHDETLYEPSTSEISVAALAASPRHGKESILVVEDDDVVRDLIARILRRHGYEVLIADGPEQALQLIQGGQPLDLLLTDMIMPEMNGMELAAKILAKRPGLHVLYASGHAGSEFVQDASADALHFLSKPFTAQSLIAKIREVLQS